MSGRLYVDQATLSRQEVRAAGRAVTNLLYDHSIYANLLRQMFSPHNTSSHSASSSHYVSAVKVN